MKCCIPPGETQKSSSVRQRPLSAKSFPVPLHQSSCHRRYAIWQSDSDLKYTKRKKARLLWWMRLDIVPFCFLEISKKLRELFNEGSEARRETKTEECMGGWQRKVMRKWKAHTFAGRKMIFWLKDPRFRPVVLLVAVEKSYPVKLRHSRYHDRRR